MQVNNGDIVVIKSRGKGNVVGVATTADMPKRFRGKTKDRFDIKGFKKICGWRRNGQVHKGQSIFKPRITDAGEINIMIRGTLHVVHKDDLPYHYI